MSDRFNKELLCTLVTGIDVDWMESYGNMPRIRLRGPIEDYRVRNGFWKDAKYKRYPCDKTSLWVGEDPAGFVHYLAHSGSGKDEGGFGGAIYDLTLTDGSKKTLRGPWSSRATAVNMVLPEGDHIMDTAMGAMRIDAFIYLCELYEVPFFVLRQKVTSAEPAVVCVSVRPDGAFKPNGNGQWDNDRGPFEVLYAPKGN